MDVLERPEKPNIKGIRLLRLKNKIQWKVSLLMEGTQVKIGRRMSFPRYLWKISLTSTTEKIYKYSRRIYHSGSY